MSTYLGILGGGNISETHTRAALEINGVTVTAVCGPNLKKVSRLAHEAGATAYQELEQFFRHKPMDAVLIGSPSGLHAQQGIAAARHGLHVLVEKPIDVTTERTDSLIAECERARVKLGVFFQDRVAPGIAKLKRVIDSGELGRPILMSASVRWYRPPEYYGDSQWRGTRALDGGGALMNQGIHTVDLLQWLFGGIAVVWGKTLTALHRIESEDTVVASLGFRNGAIGNLEAATSAYPGFARRIEMTWSQGTVVLEGDHIRSSDLRMPVWELSAGEPKSDDSRATSPVVSDTRGHRKIIEDFLDSVASGGMPICDGHQARRSVEFVQAVYESSRTGHPVKIGGS